jgi:hypothetical protein
VVTSKWLLVSGNWLPRSEHGSLGFGLGGGGGGGVSYFFPFSVGKLGRSSVGISSWMRYFGSLVVFLDMAVHATLLVSQDT